MKKNITSFAILLTLSIAVLISWLEFYFLMSYGWTVFLLIPFILGFLPTFIVSQKMPVTFRKSMVMGFGSLGLTIVGLLVFAMEGLICIAMSSPILAVLTFAGVYLSYLISSRKWSSPANTTIILMVLSLGTMGFDAVKKPQTLIPVTTSVRVKAPIETVWNHVVTFDSIPPPQDWIFHTGISYPTDATISGNKTNAIRYCNFTTGSFIEPITTWEEPYLLQFDVIDQPIPMQEMNPFWDIHPPHLEGYFLSRKGQFKLEKGQDNSTILEGTTWYTLDIYPEFYWKVWSDEIIHRIHLRVLNHIKTTSEQHYKTHKHE